MGARATMEIRVEAHGPHVAVVTIDNQPRRNAAGQAFEGAPPPHTHTETLCNPTIATCLY